MVSNILVLYLWFSNRSFWLITDSLTRKGKSGPGSNGSKKMTSYSPGPFSSGSRIHWLHLCWEVEFSNECPRYDTKQSDGEASVMLDVWEMQNTLLLLSLPGPL